MRDETQDLSVHYIGPLVDSGRIDVFVFSDSLRGLGRLTNRAGYLLYGPDANCRLELASGLRPGSVVAPFYLASGLVEHVETILTSPGVQALATLMGLLGWGIVPAAQSLYKIFKNKRGRPLTEEDNFGKVLGRVENIEQLLLIKIYNDVEIQAALRAVLRPLRVEGIVEIQTRRNNVVIDSVTKQDLFAADQAESSAIQEIDERILNIEKVALMPHLAWHLSDAGGPFDAKIYDEELWERIAKGERFGFGDRLRVELRTTFSRDQAGRLTIERVIPRVLEVEHASPSQQQLPFS